MVKLVPSAWMLKMVPPAPAGAAVQASRAVELAVRALNEAAQRIFAVSVPLEVVQNGSSYRQNSILKMVPELLGPPAT